MKKCNQFKTKIYLEGYKMTENQKYEVLRKQKVEELTKQLKALLPKILERYTFNEDKPDDLKSQELSLNAKIGSKNNTYLNITNDVITSPDQYVSMWFDGLLNHIEVVDKGMEEICAAYNFQQLLVNDDDLMQYTILFLKRTYWRNCYSISKLRPTEKDAELWIGQKNAVYGLLITPRFKNGNWENDVSEIRRFRQDYFTIGHILETGLVIPYENDKIKFNSVDEYLTFFKNVLVRLSGSPYELKIAELYCEYVRSSANPYKVPLLIPELRYNGLENNHVYRLDFTIINPITLEKHGFEFSPWSTHGYLGGIKGKTQKEVNEEAKANFEHEMKKHKDYYRNLNIFTLIYTDTDLQDIDNIFADMKEYLAPKRENKQLLESVIERIKNYRKTP